MKIKDCQFIMTNDYNKPIGVSIISMLNKTDYTHPKKIVHDELDDEEEQKLMDEHGYDLTLGLTVPYDVSLKRFRYDLIDINIASNLPLTMITFNMNEIYNEEEVRQVPKYNENQLCELKELQYHGFYMDLVLEDDYPYKSFGVEVPTKQFNSFKIESNPITHIRNVVFYMSDGRKVEIPEINLYMSSKINNSFIISSSYPLKYMPLNGPMITRLRYIQAVQDGLESGNSYTEYLLRRCGILIRAEQSYSDTFDLFKNMNGTNNVHEAFVVFMPSTYGKEWIIGSLIDITDEDSNPSFYKKIIGWIKGKSFNPFPPLQLTVSTAHFHKFNSANHNKAVSVNYGNNEPYKITLHHPNDGFKQNIVYLTYRTDDRMVETIHEFIKVQETSKKPMSFNNYLENLISKY